MSIHWRAWMAAIPLALLLTACTASIQHGLTEREANQIIVLLRQKGIEAVKQKVPEGREIKWAIVVPKSEMAKSIKLLREYNLPRKKDRGFGEIFGKTGMIPTATEERAKLLMALSGELVRTLKTVDGVLDARVHIVIPQEKILQTPNQKVPKPSASVLLKVRTRAGLGYPIKKPEVRKLVARSVEGLDPNRVEIIYTLGQPLAISTTEGVSGKTTKVLFITVAQKHAGRLKATLGAMILLLVMFMSLFVWFFIRASSLKNQIAASGNNFNR